MPQLLAAALVSYGVAATTALVIANGVFLLGGLALSSYQQRKAAKKATADYNAAQVDRMANVVTTIVQRDLVLGRVRKGGGVYFRGSAGAHRETFLMHVALAGHEIDAVEQVYFNDQPMALDGNGYVVTAPYYQTRNESAVAYIYSPGTTVELPEDPVPDSVSVIEEAIGIGDAASGGGPVPFTLAGRTVTLAAASATTVHVNYQVQRGTSYARVWSELGDPNALADARTKALFPDMWTDAHRGRGVAKLLVEFVYNETAFPSGLPAVTALVRGAKVFDPRTSTTAWSDNPALLARHVYQHANFGKATVSAAEDTRFIAAANACDVAHTYQTPAGPSNRAMFRAAIVAPYGSPARDLLDDLAQAMGGMWAFAGGEFYVRAGVYTASVMTLTEADLAVVQREGDSQRQEPIAISVHRERAQKFNVVNPRIWDESQTFKLIAVAPVRSAALIARDGEELAQEVSMPAVTYAPQAEHVAGIMMRDARDPLTVEASFKLKAWPLELFDTIGLTIPNYGWSAKPFMVMSRLWDRERGVVKLTLKETSAAIYTPDAQFLSQGGAANSALPRPWEIDPPVLSTAGIYSGTGELVALADGTILTRVRVTWPAVLDPSVLSGLIEVQWANATAGTWAAVTVPGDSTEAILIGPRDGAAIVVRARSRNSVAVSDWCVQVVHQVIGKTEPPPDVANFSIQGQTLSWPAVDAADLAGYLVRFNYGQNTDWGAATPLHIGVITESPWTPKLFPSGQVTLLIKAQDTTGNQSDNAAWIVANIGNVIVANLVLTYDDKAAGFPGSKTGCTVVAGDLLADDSGILFWGSSTARFWGTDTSLVWPTASYLELQYVTGYSVQATEAGARLTLSATVAGASYTIEYRYDTQGFAWGDNTSYFWVDDAALFWAQPTEWQTWPGALEGVVVGLLQLQITAQAGTVRGSVTALALLFDVVDEGEEFDDVAISAAGTRLPITKSYRSINNIQLTLQDDGGSAVSAQWVDKNATLGPLVQCINSAGALVTGVLDARIQGVKG